MVGPWRTRDGRRVRWVRLVHAEGTLSDPNPDRRRSVVRAVMFIFASLVAFYLFLTVVLGIELFR